MDETQKDDAAVAEASADEKAAPVAEKTEEKKEEKKEEKIEIPAKFKKIVEEIENMAVLDLHELVKVFEKKFGVSAAAVAPAGQSPLGAAGEAKEEKSTFIVELTDGGAQKIAVIKVIKEALTLGLKDAKDKVDGAPTVIAENMKKEDAEALKKSVEAAGGKVTLK